MVCARSSVSGPHVSISAKGERERETVDRGLMPPAPGPLCAVPPELDSGWSRRGKRWSVHADDAACPPLLAIDLAESDASHPSAPRVIQRVVVQGRPHDQDRDQAVRVPRTHTPGDALSRRLEQCLMCTGVADADLLAEAERRGGAHAKCSIVPFDGMGVSEWNDRVAGTKFYSHSGQRTDLGKATAMRAAKLTARSDGCSLLTHSAKGSSYKPRCAECRKLEERLRKGLKRATSAAAAASAGEPKKPRTAHDSHTKHACMNPGDVDLCSAVWARSLGASAD